MNPMEPNDELLSKRKFKVLVEEHKFQNFFFMDLYVKLFTYDIKEAFGSNLRSNFMELRGDYMRWAVDLEAFDKMALDYLELVKSKPSFVEGVNKKLFSAIEAADKFSHKLLVEDFSHKTNQELWSYYDKDFALQRDMIKWGMIAPMMEVHNPIYTDFLTQLVAEKNEKLGAGVSVAEAVAVLSTFQGQTEAKREQLALLKLAQEVKSAENLPKFSDQLKKHAEEFGWMMYNFSGPGWEEKDYLEAIVPLLKENIPKLKKLEEAENEIEAKRQLVEEKLRLNEKEQMFFKIARDFMKGKALRRESSSFAAYASEPLHREIARRLNLSLVQMRLLTPEELKKSLLDGGAVDISAINQRTKYFVYGLFEDGKYCVIATGKEAEPFSEAIKEKKISKQISELLGTCACSGKVRGVVKIVNRPTDVAKMRQGDVLVSIATTPDLIAAMRLASAIVTDSGGLTSHAAIVSRELNVPCIIGTKIATKVLRDGDKVEVDATAGLVKKL